MTAMVLGSFLESTGDGNLHTFDTYGNGGSGTTAADFVLGAFTGVEGFAATIESREDIEALGLAMLFKDTEINDAGIDFRGLVSRTFLGVGGGGRDIMKVTAVESGEFYGRGGDDWLELYGNGPSGSLNGGEGDDRLYGAEGDNTLVGWTGDDTLMAGIGADSLLGGAGVDTLDYGKVISGGVVVNLSATGPQDTGQGGVDIVSGFENLSGTWSGDNLSGDDGANRIDGREGFDTLWGGDGADTLVGGGGRNSLHGGIGDDWISYADAPAAVSADLMAHFASRLDDPNMNFDIIDQVERLSGSDFADTLGGDDGRNTLLGGDGDDVIGGLGEVDILDGGAGNDAIDGGDGDDVISGWDGADTITGGAGDDTLIGGSGRDTVDYRDAAAGVTVRLAFFSQQTGGAGVDDLSDFECATGSAFRDLLTGDAQDNRLDGRGGQDGLAGGFGADTLVGGAGKDVLIGGAGGDVMTGGVGKDRYVYAFTSESWKVDVDLITDLDDGEDRILLTDIDAKASKAGNQAFELVEALSGKAGQAALVYDAGSDRTRLLLDTDGDAKADATILLAGDHSDFVNFAL